MWCALQITLSPSNSVREYVLSQYLINSRRNSFSDVANICIQDQIMILPFPFLIWQHELIENNLANDVIYAKSQEFAMFGGRKTDWGSWKRGNDSFCRVSSKPFLNFGQTWFEFIRRAVNRDVIWQLSAALIYFKMRMSYGADSVGPSQSNGLSKFLLPVALFNWSPIHVLQRLAGYHCDWILRNLNIIRGLLISIDLNSPPISLTRRSNSESSDWNSESIFDRQNPSRTLSYRFHINEETGMVFAGRFQ